MSIPYPDDYQQAYKLEQPDEQKRLVADMRAQGMGWTAANWPVEKQMAAQKMLAAADLIEGLTRKLQVLEEITGKVEVSWGVEYTDPVEIVEGSYDWAIKRMAQGYRIHIRYQGEWMEVE